MNIREPRDFKLIQRSPRRRILRGRLRSRLIMCLIIIIIAAPSLTYWQYSRPILPISPITFSAVSKSQPVVLSWPANAQAAIWVEGQNQIITNGEQSPVPTASVAKVMVALLILKKHPIQPGQQGQVITITDADVDNYNRYVSQGGSVLAVQTGEQLSEYQALQALMLPSANNIADKMAVWTFGSMAEYHSQANQLAQSLGMTKTNFGADASGLDPKTVSTAHDMVLLGQEALKYPVLKEIMAQKTTELPIAGLVTNYNAVLGKNGIFGIKTGNTEEAGGCFLFASQQKLGDGSTRTVIGSIMKASFLYEAMGGSLPLVDSAFKGFGPINVAAKDQVVAEYKLPWGGTAKAMVASDLKVFGWLNGSLNAKIDVNPLQAPAAKGAQVGSVSIKNGDKTISVPVVLDDAVTLPSPSWRMKRTN